MLVIKDVSFAKHGTLADRSTRLTFDTQEMSDNDSLEMIKLYKQRSVNMIIMTNEEFSVFEEILNNKN